MAIPFNRFLYILVKTSFLTVFLGTVFFYLASTYSKPAFAQLNNCAAPGETIRGTCDGTLRPAVDCGINGDNCCNTYAQLYNTDNPSSTPVTAQCTPKCESAPGNSQSCVYDPNNLCSATPVLTCSEGTPVFCCTYTQVTPTPTPTSGPAPTPTPVPCSVTTFPTTPQNLTVGQTTTITASVTSGLGSGSMIRNKS